MKRIVGALAICAVVFVSGVRADVIDNSGAGFVIPDNNPTGLSSSINIATNETIIGDVVLTIRGFSHTWVGDLIVTLTGPGGTVDIMRRTGSTTGTGIGDSSNLDGTYLFADSGSNFWLAATGGLTSYVIPAATYRASTTGANVNAGTDVLLNSFFAGSSTMGTWTLNISDNAAADTGSIAGWGVSIVSVPEPSSFALGLMSLGLLIRRRR